MDDTQIQTEPQVNDSAEVLVNLESLIKNSITGIDRKKNELRKLNEMVTSFLSQDPTYQEHEKLAKEAGRVKNATKSQLLKQPSVADTMQKVKELKTELKETEDGMSDYLREYQRMSGSNEIQDDNGEVREIIYIAKLLKRASRGK